MAVYIIFALNIIVAFIWLWLFVKKYSWFTVKGLLAHMMLFGILSVVIMWIAVQLVFLPVDPTYSASNIGTLGLFIVMLFICMAVATVIAWGMNIAKLIEYKYAQKKDEDSVVEK